MKFYLGVTDIEWYRHLSTISPEDVNFWQPGGNSNFKVLSPGAPFLFKLKHPYNSIGGIGFFSSQTKLPMNMAWEIFANRNGCNTYTQFQRMVLQYRKNKENTNPVIGCIVLTNPVFFKKEDWISIPADWSKSIVQGKSYDTTTEIGVILWQQVELLLERYLQQDFSEGVKSQLTLEPSEERYGNSVLRKVRLG